MTKSAFIKNMLALIQSVDKTAAILSYDDSSQANSICHPSHVPSDHDEFKIYFPKATQTNRGLITKCRMTSSIYMAEIKWKLRPKLEGFAYYIWPTPIKATRTAKAG